MVGVEVGGRGGKGGGWGCRVGGGRWGGPGRD